jgi:hypothetical protein
MNNTKRNTVGGRPIVQCTSPSRPLMREPMLLYTFSAILSPSIPCGGSVGPTKLCEFTLLRILCSDFHTFGRWSCSLQGIFCGTHNRHAIPCSPPTLVLWSGQSSALGVVSFVCVCLCVCVCVCVCLCLCVFSASASLCCHTAPLPLPRQRLRLWACCLCPLSPSVSW